MEIEQTTWGCHDDIRPAPEGIDLRPESDTAKKDGLGDRGLSSIGVDALTHLRGKFPGGNNDQHRGSVPRTGLTGQESLKNGQGKGSGLARAGLGSGQKVMPLQNARDGFFLNRGRAFVAFVGQGVDQTGIKAQRRKFHELRSPVLTA